MSYRYSPRMLLNAGVLLAFFGWCAPAFGQTTNTTARDSLSAVIEAAEEVASGVSLVAILATDVAPEEGTASSFLYLFATENLSETVLVIKDEDAIVAFDGAFASGTFISSLLPSGFELQPLPETFIDSDQAFERAEMVGGTEFRNFTPGVTEATAILVNPGGNLLGGGDGEALEAVWIITYGVREAQASRVYLVEARTGNAVELEPTTARSNLAVANETASTRFADDAHLVQINTVVPDVGTAGQSLLWAYTYYSPAESAYRIVTVIDGNALSISLPAEAPETTDRLPAGFIDSSVAAEAADTTREGQPVRTDSVGTLVQARLAQGIFPGDPARAVWEFLYIPLSGDEVTRVFVDATSGQEVRVGTEDEPGALPAAFSLAQNYPNPFNPETTIRYELARQGTVTLSVYNVLGQRVRVLFSGTRAPGSHEVRWDGTDEAGQPVPSGVYLYRLESGSAVETRTMILLQ